MPSLFKHISQIHSRADYDKLLRKALAPGNGQEGVGPAEEFHYFEEFAFDKKPGTLLLVGDVSKALLGDLKKLGSGYARGTCRMAPDHRVLVDIEIGKVKPKLINGALKASGLKLLAVVNGEEPEPDPEMSEGPQELPPQPVPPQPKAPPSPEQQLWMDSVKLLRPAFDKALQLARTTDPRWAEDLDSNFSQMIQEARAGDFKAAMGTLKRLAVILRSREAARAEVKHQTMQEDPELAQRVREQAEHLATVERENPGMREDLERSADEQGIGLTSDGVAGYVRAITLEEWNAEVLGPLETLGSMLNGVRRRDLDFHALTGAVEKLSAMVGKAFALSQEEEDQPRLQEAAWALQDRMGALSEASQMLARAPGLVKLLPENMLIRLAEVNRIFQGILIAKSDQVQREIVSIQGEKTREQLALGEEARVLGNEQDHAARRREMELKDRYQKLEDELLELPSTDRTPAEDDRLQDIEEDLQQIAFALHQTAESRESRINLQTPQEFVQLVESVDFKTLKQVSDAWNQQAEAVKRCIDAGKWDLAAEGITAALSSLSVLLTEETPPAVSRLHGELDGLRGECLLAKLSSASSSEGALQALESVVQSCGEFQQLYFFN